MQNQTELSDAELSQIEHIIGYTFSETNREHLKEALSHRSLKGEGASRNNERLAFLGDSILYQISTEILFNRTPESTTKDMHDHREKSKNNGWLGESEIANAIGEFLLVGNSRRGKEPSIKMKATMIEAIIGAIYLSDRDEAIKFVNRLISEQF